MIQAKWHGDPRSQGRILPIGISCPQKICGGFLLGYQDFNQSDNNEYIIAILQISKNVMASASKAECAALFINTKEATVLQTKC